jgi:hypothetical protein
VKLLPSFVFHFRVEKAHNTEQGTSVVICLLHKALAVTAHVADGREGLGSAFLVKGLDAANLGLLCKLKRLRRFLHGDKVGYGVKR